MKTHLGRLAALTLLLSSALPAFAGPFATKLIVGVDNQDDFTITVPLGRAISLTNFVSYDVAKVSVKIGNKVADVLAATSPDDMPTSTGKEIVINGPAIVSVNVVTGRTAFLTYKSFAN